MSHGKWVLLVGKHGIHPNMQSAGMSDIMIAAE